MNRLQDFEEWKAFRVIQPSIKHILEIALRDPQSRSFSYFEDLENVKLELDHVSLIDSQQSFSSDGLIGDVKRRLGQVLAVLDNLVTEDLFLQPVSGLQIASDFSESHSSVITAALSKYPNLQRLARLTLPIGGSVKNLELKEKQWKRASDIIKETNRFLDSDSQPHETLAVETGAQNVHVKVDNRIHNFVSITLQDIQTKLSECQNEVTHNTLFTISGLETLGDQSSTLHLDLLFKSCIATDKEIWQAASCHYDSSPTNRGGLECHPIQPVDNLCETIGESLDYKEHLHLRLENQKVVHCNSTDSGNDIRRTESCRSLGDLLENDWLRPLGVTSGGVTPWEKRTLALQLSHLFLHLYDCEWAGNCWTTSGVQFAFSGRWQKRLELPPYLKCNDSKESRSGKEKSTLRALAKLLIEIELGEEIKELRLNMLNKPDLLWTLTEILREGRLSCSKFYIEAVEQCLKLSRSKGLESIRDEIREKIVKNLQTELIGTREPTSEIPLFSRSNNMDNVIPVTLERGSGTSFLPPKKRRPQSLSHITDSLHTFRHSHLLSPGYPRGSKKRRKKSWSDQRQAIKEYIRDYQNPRSRKQGFIRLFDEFGIRYQDEHNKASAEEFVRLYADFRLETTCDIKLSTKIKVCVIDTGLNENQLAIQAAMILNNIKERRSFIGKPDDTVDHHGHGTHMVELLLRSSANVEIYCAKIADRPYIPQDNIKVIAAAINYAVTEWKVDIITMSFGFRDRNEEVNDAIKQADLCGTLLFASAANHGNNRPRTWPARSDRVICISASDGKGKDGGISPAALEHDDNFMTLGISVPLFWNAKRVYKSGTSYATPIAVGFAINVLEIGSSLPGAVTSLKERGNMLKVFRHFSSPDNGYSYIAPWKLWEKFRDLNQMRIMIDNELR